MISNSDFEWFVNRALNQMQAILVELGDEKAGEHPTFANANSPYGIVTHCLGVMASWAGHFVAGREVVRDRPAEWGATGSVEDLIARTNAARTQLTSDIASLDADAPLAHAPDPQFAEIPFGQRQGAALMHLYEELSQHLGQLELTRDILLGSA